MKITDNGNDLVLVDNDRKDQYQATFGKKKFYPTPLAKRVFLEMETKSTSGIILAQTRHQDAPQIKKVTHVAPDCLFVKADGYYLVNMNNRPEVVYGPDGIAYFMVFEHDVTVKYSEE